MPRDASPTSTNTHENAMTRLAAASGIGGPFGSNLSQPTRLPPHGRAHDYPAPAHARGRKRCARSRNTPAGAQRKRGHDARWDCAPLATVASGPVCAPACSPSTRVESGSQVLMWRDTPAPCPCSASGSGSRRESSRCLGRWVWTGAARALPAYCGHRVCAHTALPWGACVGGRPRRVSRCNCGPPQSYRLESLDFDHFESYVRGPAV